ncbi:hypothetical protein Aperf_G00000001385 [Anoplocephala perfoliata]
MRRIVDAIIKKVDDNEFTAMLMSMCDFDEIFQRTDSYTLSRILEKISNLDKFLYNVKASILKAIMKTLHPTTYMEIEPLLHWTKLRLQEMEAQGYMNIPEMQADESSAICPTLDEVFFTSMPNIPLELADSLLGLDINTLHYIISNHFNLPALLAVMQPSTLDYVLANAPFVDDYIVLMNAETQQAILSKMPYPCEYLQSICPEYAEIIIGKLPHYRSCIPPPTRPKTIATTATTMPGPTSTVGPPSTGPMFTAQELEKMSQQVPKIRELLAKVNPKKVERLRSTFPDFLKLFNGLDKTFIDALNKTNFSGLKSEAIRDFFSAVSNDDEKIIAFANLFT